MPANLTPEYKQAEEAYREARDPAEKLRCLEEMLRTIPKHKGTEKMQADIKRRIARTKEGLEKGGGKKGFGVRVERAGAAQVVLIGAPNSGKSSLVEVTTNARVEVGDHPYATHSPVPAMLDYQDLQFQLVDLPPISAEHMEHWVTDIIRVADCGLLVVDSSDSDVDAQLDEVLAVLDDRKVELVGPDALIPKGPQAIRKLPSCVIAAKTDEPSAEEGLSRIRDRFESEFSVLPLSALADTDFSVLGRTLFDLNRIVRVYSKAPGKDADKSKPFIMHRGDVVIDFCRQVHKDFAENLQFARVWGDGVFDGQRVQRDHELTDGDVIELHL